MLNHTGSDQISFYFLMERCLKMEQFYIVDDELWEYVCEHSFMYHPEEKTFSIGSGFGSGYGGDILLDQVEILAPNCLKITYSVYTGSGAYYKDQFEQAKEEIYDDTNELVVVYTSETDFRLESSIRYQKETNDFNSSEMNMLSEEDTAIYRAKQEKVKWTSDETRIARLDKLQQKTDLQTPDEIKELLDLMLDKARYLNSFGNLETVSVIYEEGGRSLDISIWGHLDPEEGVEVCTSKATHFHDSIFCTFYPIKTLPYATVEEMRNDFCNIFTDDIIFDGFLQTWFPNTVEQASIFMDVDGRLYANGDVGFTAYIPEWDTDTMEILSVSSDKIQVQMAVTVQMTSEWTDTLEIEMEGGRWNFTESYYAYED